MVKIICKEMISSMKFTVHAGTATSDLQTTCSFNSENFVSTSRTDIFAFSFELLESDTTLILHGLE